MNDNQPGLIPCKHVNLPLWEKFAASYLAWNRSNPIEDQWSEQECQQWVDLVLPEYQYQALLHVAEQEYEYYKQFDQPMWS